MATKSDKVRSSKLQGVRRLVESGVYDDALILDDIVDRILAGKGPRSLLSALDQCPVGDGEQYKHLVARVFAKAFAGDVDVPLMRSEFSLAGGRGDLELPFRIDAFDRRPLLRDWRHRFNVSSVLIEVKNERNPNPPDHVRQIESDIGVSPLGKVGFLVCRNGFTDDAFKRMIQVNKSQTVLILPFAHEELSQLVTMSRSQVQHFLHRKELRLLQLAC